MSISVEITMHLPGVVFENASPLPLGSGEVKHLTFEQWQRLDPAFPLLEKKFQQAKPVFWTGNMSCEGATPEAVGDFTKAIANQVHNALLLIAKVPWLPTPILSAIYCRFVPPDATSFVNALCIRLIGPMEREWIVYGSELTVPLHANDIAWAHFLYPYLAADVSPRPAVKAGLSVLQRTALPESWWGTPYKRSINEFLHCVAACENEMVPTESAVDITTMFGRQAAALLTAQHSEIKSLAKQWSEVYRLRTALMHGRLGFHDLDEAQQHLLAYPRVLLRAIVVAALLLEPSEASSLGDLCEIAYTDPEAHHQLHDRLQSLL